MRKQFSVLLLMIALCCASAFAQRGTALPVPTGTAFPSSAPYSALFFNSTTPGLYICDNSPNCTTSGQWLLAGGAGGTCSGTCANLTLSNLSGTVAINEPLLSATNTNLSLQGAAGTASYNPGTSSLIGGAAFSGSSQAGAAAYVTGGTGGTSGGGAVIVESGGAPSGDASGNVSVFTAPGVGTGPAGGLFLYAGNGGTTGAGGSIFGQAGHSGTLTSTGNGYISLAAGGASYAACSPLSGYECGFLFLAGATGAGPGEIDLTGGGSTSGVVRLSNMSLAFYGDATYPLDLPTQRPTNAYFAGNVYATATSGGLNGGYSSLAAGTTLSTQNAANWHAEGQYGGTAVSQPGTMAAIFGAGGTIQYSYNGGGSNTLAALTSNISGNSSTANALAATPTQCGENTAMSGIQANGNANCGTLNFLSLQETTDQASPSGGLVIWGGSSTHGPRYSENGGPATALGAYPNIMNTLLGAANANTVEVSNGVNPQAVYIYQTTDDTNYSRLGLLYDSTSADNTLWSQNGGSSSLKNLGFGVGNYVRWEVNGSSPYQLRPSLAGSASNIEDIGDSTHQVHDLWLGTELYLNSITVGFNGDVSAINGSLMAAGIVTGSRKSLCTDASGNLTITTVGCQPVTLSGTSGSISGALSASCNSGTVSITGATTSMVASTSPAGGVSVGTGVYWFAQVTSAGTVTVWECAISSVTPSADTFNVRVTQ